MVVFPFQSKRGQGYWLGCILSILFMLVIAVSNAKAFLPDSQNKQLTLSGRNLYPNNPKGKYEGPSRVRLRGFQDENKDEKKPEWIGLWNSWGTIHRLYASGQFKTTRLRVTDKKATDEEIRSIAIGYIEEYSAYFKLDPGDLLLDEVINRGGIFYCRFKQLYKGIEVYGGGIQFRFDENGGLLLIGGDTYPGIGISPYPSVSKKEAASIALQEPAGLDREKRTGDIELFVLPIPLDNGLEYVLAWQVPVFADYTGKSILIFVDANNGRIILSYRLDRPAITGRVGGVILPEYFNDSLKWVPFSNQDVYLLNQDLPVYENNLDTDPGWRREGMWEFGDPVPQDIYLYGHAGCPDPDEGYTGQNVFGYNLTGDYTNLMKPRYLSTDNINCMNKTGVILTFWRWLGVQREYWETDEGSRTDYDTASIEVSNDSGLTWIVIWANGTSQVEDGVYDGFLHTWKGWNLQFFDISDLADGKDIVIRWGIGPTDGSGTFCGWNLDDIGLYESLDTITDPNGYFEFPDTGGVLDNSLISLLKGNHVNVINEDGYSAVYRIDNISANPNYPITVNWDANQTSINGLDELNAFYHINVLLNYVKKIDPLYNAMDEQGPIKVIVRYGDNYKNAFWSPQHMICFGEGDSRPDGYRNFALFSDIIFHEYMHAITDSFYSFFMPPLTSVRKTTSGDQTGPVFVTEFDAMHEAFSDYWACTINDDSMVGDGDFWIGHKYVRSLDNQFKYPDDYGDDAYANSLIISGAMWEARELLGKDITDPLFHLARYGGATTFQDFLIDVLLQDEISFNGDHVELLKNIFGLRGISRAPTAPSGLVARAGDTYIDLEWHENPDIDEVEGYYVYFRTENDIASDKEDPSVRREAGLFTSYRLEGLTNGTTYVLKIAAYNEYRAESDPSELVYATPYSNSSLTSSGSERKAFCFIGSLSY